MITLPTDAIIALTIFAVFAVATTARLIWMAYHCKEFTNKEDKL